MTWRSGLKRTATNHMDMDSSLDNYTDLEVDLLDTQLYQSPHKKSLAGHWRVILGSSSDHPRFTIEALSCSRNFLVTIHIRYMWYVVFLTNLKRLIKH